MLTQDTDELLRQYYAWSETNNPADIYYPHIDPVRRLRGGSVSALSISDEEAQYIDRALCVLKTDNPDTHWVIEQVYRYRKTLRWLERRGRGDRRALARQAADGREFVRGFLAGQALL